MAEAQGHGAAILASPAAGAAAGPATIHIKLQAGQFKVGAQQEQQAAHLVCRQLDQAQGGAQGCNGLHQLAGPCLVQHLFSGKLVGRVGRGCSATACMVATASAVASLRRCGWPAWPAFQPNHAPTCTAAAAAAAHLVVHQAVCNPASGVGGCHRDHERQDRVGRGACHVHTIHLVIEGGQPAAERSRVVGRVESEGCMPGIR